MFKAAYETIGDAYARWSADDGPLLSAGVAYYVALSLFPLLLILIACLGFFFGLTDSGQQAEAHLLNAVGEQFSPALEDQLRNVFDQVRDQAIVGGPIGLFTLLVACLAMFLQFDHAFDSIWNIEPKSNRGLWRSVLTVLQTRLKALAMLLALGAIVILVFVAGIALAAVQEMSQEILPWSAQFNWLLEFSVSVAMNAAAFTLIYRLIPKVEVRWRDALAGGIFAAITWEVGRQALARFVIGQRYSSAYGLLGSFLAIMLWAYYAVSVLFFGGEFVQAIRARRKNSGAEQSTDEQHVAP